MSVEPSSVEMGVEPANVEVNFESSSVKVSVEPSSVVLSVKPSSVVSSVEPSSVEMSVEPASVAGDVKKQSPSLSTRLGFPVKVSVHGLMSLLMTVVGEEVLRLIFSVVRAACGDVTMCGDFAACGACITAGFLAVVACVRRDAKLPGPSALRPPHSPDESTLNGGRMGMVLISKVVVCFACWATEVAAIILKVVAFGESFDDSGLPMLSLVGGRRIGAVLGQQHERRRRSGRSPKVRRFSRRMRRRDRKVVDSQG